MKRLLIALFTFVMMALVIVLPIVAAAEAPVIEPPPALTPEPALVAEVSRSEASPAVITAAAVEPPDPGEPFTWKYLATIAGAAAFTLIVVEFLKVPLDKVWKIPTRVFAYFIALLGLLVGTAFTDGLTADSALLCVVNAFLAATTAYGAYELTFHKLEDKLSELEI